MTENTPEEQPAGTPVPVEVMLRAQLEESQRHAKQATERCINLNIGQQLMEAAHAEETAALREQLDELRREAAGRTHDTADEKGSES